MMGVCQSAADLQFILKTFGAVQVRFFHNFAPQSDYIQNAICRV